MIRSAIHDLANVLSGIRGILELSDPDKPLSPRSRARLEAVLEDGMTTLERARSLALDQVPEDTLETGPEWRRALSEELRPLEVVFRCSFEISFEGDPRHDAWPGQLLRGYVHALSRQLLPYLRDPVMVIQGGADAREWRLAWRPAAGLPESLQSDKDTHPRDINARWALHVGRRLGTRLSVEDGAVVARIPRP